jgi:coiled-coil domain-containing protein 61
MEISKSVDMVFHGVEFIITINSNSEALAVEVEETKTGHRWRGEYSKKYIEDITQKTGNAKKFSVFVKMLLNSLENSSDSVFVDLLTYQDLEMLKARKG